MVGKDAAAVRRGSRRMAGMRMLIDKRGLFGVTRAGEMGKERTAGAGAGKDMSYVCSTRRYFNVEYVLL